MTNPECSGSSPGENSGGRYRVRPFLAPERSAPDQDPGPRFLCRDAAESYANRRALHQTMILEKLAPAGCWLPLTTLG